MKKIAFLTGTRADFGKMKSLIKVLQNDNNFETLIFATGMHMNPLYGLTIDEIYKSGFKNIFQYINHETIQHMDRTLAKTILGFSRYIEDFKPDLIVVHGDRVEALAGAIVGSLNNILVAHIEGGEISGTIDEHIRHSVTKMSHIHLVANIEAEKRLIQLGEHTNSIFIIGSPDLDLMNPKFLPKIEDSKKYYNINYKNFSIAMFHPVTTEYEYINEYANLFVETLIESKLNYIVIYPNNDLGSIEILTSFRKIENRKNFKIFPSLRFEHFLNLLRSSDFIIGNSSAGIREAPYYDIPTIDIGTRQLNRVTLNSVFHCDYKKEEILKTISLVKNYKQNANNYKNYFGEGQSDQIFINLLKTKDFWDILCQKQFQDLSI